MLKAGTREGRAYGAGAILGWVGELSDASAETLFRLHAHRGAIASTRCEGAVLSHCRYRRDESTGANRAGDDTPQQLLVVIDGQIENLPELAGELDHAAGESIRDQVARALARRGHEFFEQALGEYAVAIWEPRTTTLYLARGLFAVRPLFYATRGAITVFGAEPSAVAMTCFGQAEPDMQAVAELAVDAFGEDGRTLWKGVRAVPPASVVSIRAGHVHVKRTWWPEELPYSSIVSQQDLAERVAVELAKGLRARFDSMPGAILMSGGLDSTNLAAIAATSCASPPMLAHIANPGLPSDERKLARATADRIGLPLHEFDPRSDPLTSPDAPAHLDVLFLPTLQWAAAANAFFDEQGVRVVATGQGADHAIRPAWLDWARDLLAQGRWLRALRTVGPRVLASALRPRDRLRAQLRDQLLAPRYRAQVRESRRALHASWDARRFVDHVRELHCETIWDGRLLTLPLSVDERFGAQFGIRYTHPFLDRRVFELLLTAPQHLKAPVWRGLDKPIMRAVGRSRLPARVVRARKKVNFNAYSDECLERSRWLAQPIERFHLVREGIVDGGEAARVWEERGYSRLPLATAELWLRDISIMR